MLFTDVGTKELQTLRNFNNVWQRADREPRYHLSSSQRNLTFQLSLASARARACVLQNEITFWAFGLK